MRSPKLSHIEAVFFDLDGTLIDTAPDFIIAINRLREEYDLGPLADSQIRPHVSNGSLGLITHCFDFNCNIEFEKARNRLLDLYFDVDHIESSLFEGAEKFLAQLEAFNIPWGIVTNKPVRYADPLIDRLNLRSRMVCLLCPDHVKNRKPDPESLHLAALRAQIASDKCFYLGDHSRDIDAGKAAKMLTGSVAFGYIPIDENPLDWKADYHFTNFDHIYTTFFNCDKTL